MRKESSKSKSENRFTVTLTPELAKYVNEEKEKTKSTKNSIICRALIDRYNLKWHNEGKENKNNDSN